MKEAPPLKVWVIAVGMVVLIYTFFYCCILFNPYLYFKLNKKVERVLEEQAKDKRDSLLSIVLIGSSITQMGIEENAFFQEKGKNTIKINVCKITQAQAYLEQFTLHSNAFSLLLKHPPKILFIEENLFYNISDVPDLGTQIIRKSIYIFNQVKKNPINSGNDIVLVPQKRDTVALNDYIDSIKVNRKVRIFKDNSLFHTYLDQLKKKGTKIIILNFPRPWPIEISIHSGPKEKDFQNLLAFYKAKYDVDYWKFNSPLFFFYFQDRAHLNENGREVYSNGLLGKIKKGDLN